MRDVLAADTLGKQLTMDDPQVRFEASLNLPEGLNHPLVYVRYVQAV